MFSTERHKFLHSIATSTISTSSLHTIIPYLLQPYINYIYVSSLLPLCLNPHKISPSTIPKKRHIQNPPTLFLHHCRLYSTTTDLFFISLQRIWKILSIESSNDTSISLSSRLNSMLHCHQHHLSVLIPIIYFLDQLPVYIGFVLILPIIFFLVKHHLASLYLLPWV